MGKIEDVVRSEIVRLAKKQLRADVLPLTREVRELKRTVSRMNKTVAMLERIVARQQREMQQQKAQLQVSDDEVKRARFSPALIQKLRKRLGLTQSDMATLVGVSPATIGFWESGDTAPRDANRAALVALRKLGRRDAKQLIEKKTSAAKKKATGRKKAKRGRTPRKSRKK